MNLNYIPKPEEKIKADFSRRNSKEKNDFLDFQEFKDWYESKEKICHYCGLKEEESQIIVLSGILKSSRFPQNGILGRGQSRGMWLEVDRVQPKGNYSKDNCVLCCYFCNNDKSDVFHGEDYHKFQKDRVGYLRKLIAKSND
jgi:hypothetical protein